MKNRLLKIWKENKSFLFFITLLFVFRSSFADWNEVPTGSMKPTILEGDRILVNKMAYDIRVPFTLISLFKRADPLRGDIIVFDSKLAGKRLVKRVIGLPGDRVELRNNRLYINEEQLNYTATASPVSDQFVDKKEDLFGVNHLVRVRNKASYMANFSPIVVPDNSYLVLGDNRDNSTDSRVIGFVPRNEIVGRSKRVVMSLNYNNYYFPRSERFFHKMQ